MAKINDCPNGHVLQVWIARAGTCDGCGRAVYHGEKVMDCRNCNWYLCDDCRPQGELPDYTLWSAFTSLFTDLTVTCGEASRQRARPPADELVIESHGVLSGARWRSATSEPRDEEATPDDAEAGLLDRSAAQEGGPRELRRDRAAEAKASKREPQTSKREPQTSKEHQASKTQPQDLPDLLDFQEQVDLLSSPMPANPQPLAAPRFDPLEGQLAKGALTQAVPTRFGGA